MACIDSRMLSTTVASPCPTRDVSVCAVRRLSLTLCAHAQRGFTVVGCGCLSVCLSVSVCVCVSVTQHLTSPMFVRLTNDTTYLTPNDGQNFVRFSLKMLRCKARARKSQYANTQRTGSDRSACSAYLGGTRRCNAGCVSPLVCYLVV